MQTEQLRNDPLVIGGHTFTSRFILGSGKYSLQLIEAAVRAHGTPMRRYALPGWLGNWAAVTL